jgi:hypothetical protein
MRFVLKLASASLRYRVVAIDGHALLGVAATWSGETVGS